MWKEEWLREIRKSAERSTIYRDWVRLELLNKKQNFSKSLRYEENPWRGIWFYRVLIDCHNSIHNSWTLMLDYMLVDGRFNNLMGSIIGFTLGSSQIKRINISNHLPSIGQVKSMIDFIVYQFFIYYITTFRTCKELFFLPIFKSLLCTLQYYQDDHPNILLQSTSPPLDFLDHSHLPLPHLSNNPTLLRCSM